MSIVHGKNKLKFFLCFPKINVNLDINTNINIPCRKYFIDLESPIDFDRGHPPLIKMDDPQFNTKNLKIFNDNAIDNATSFNFDSYVKSINKIIRHPENITPFSISINGKWGSGKTSLMKTLRRELNSNPQSNERKVRTVWFNAWKYSNTENLLAALASEIYQEMVNPPIITDNGLKGKISEGIKRTCFSINENVDVVKEITALAKILSLGKSPDFSEWRKTPDYKEYLPYYTYFQQFLKRIISYFVLSDLVREYDDTKGVLVIFIDDMDRCPPKDIATILEAVNLFFDQKGCIFVFGMDLSLISSAIEKQYHDYDPTFSGKNYIEKLIQLQFNLPEIRDEDIKAFFERSIPEDEPLRKYLDLIISCSERNPRKIKQFINSLRLMMILGDVIERLDVKEELLIKWTLLNFVSSRFINEIKNNNELLFHVQNLADIDSSDDFGAFQSELDSYSYSQKFVDLIYEFNRDTKISQILRQGTLRFTSDTLKNYISLSSISPNEPQVTIAASTNSIILGNSISFSGTCKDGGNTVRLMMFGPGDYSNGIEVATPEVSDSNKWKYVWAPSRAIQPGAYTAQVFDAGKIVSDKVAFDIQKGAVTIVDAGSQSYTLGERIKLSGTCTAGSVVYLSILFPQSNVQRKIDQITIEIGNNDENTFLKLDVKKDNKWEYEWDTSTIASLMNAGTYTIIACEGPYSKENIEDKAYGTVSLILKKPFVSATASQSMVAQGDTIFITGTATGNPRPGIQIWIFGQNSNIQKIVPVNSDGSFSFMLDGNETKALSPGQYFVIAQHPMTNNEFDVYPDASGQAVLSNDPKRGVERFSLTGPEGKRGAEAALALIEVINNENVDDIYTKLQFLVEKPVIQFNPISDKHIGKKFTITAATNLAVGDNVLCTVYSTSLAKSPDSEIIGGASGTVIVEKGKNGINYLSINVDPSTFEPGEYIVEASAELVDVVSKERFKII